MLGQAVWCRKSAAVLAAALGALATARLAGSQETPKPVRVSPVTEMELLPAGEFRMGEDGADDTAPAHKVRLDAFLIDRHEVTNAQYFRFCQETGHPLPFFWGMHEFRSSLDFPDHPVVGVSWDEATEYARWAGKRLPTEAEWEYAARGGLSGKAFPSGDDINRKEATFSARGTTRVAGLLPNGYGLYDMAGNVREWVMDYYDQHYYASSPVDNPKGPEKGKLVVVRGGGWIGGKMCVAVASRIALPSSWVDMAVGFRCAKDAPKTSTR
jgi:formylglycine-generating enzyme